MRTFKRSELSNQFEKYEDPMLQEQLEDCENMSGFLIEKGYNLKQISIVIVKSKQLLRAKQEVKDVEISSTSH